MNDPEHPLGWAVWRRGALLGLRFAAVFFAATGAVYLALGPLGWKGVARALCAMGVGPVVALGMIAAWWVIRPPVLAARTPVAEPGGGKSEDRHDQSD